MHYLLWHICLGHLAYALKVDELDVEEGAEEDEVLRLEVNAHELLGV